MGTVYNAELLMSSSILICHSMVCMTPINDLAWGRHYIL